MNDIHKLNIQYDFTDDLELTVKGDAYSIIKKFEQKKLSGSPFVVYDVNDVMWAFDVKLIGYIKIDNVGYNNESEDDKE